jgi:flagellar assembly protein FliH
MTSSKSTKFSPAELAALDTWTALQQFGQPRSEAVDVKQATQLLTVEQIEAMQSQAYDEAFEHGRQQGYEKGHAEGLEAGQQAGYEAGLKQGYDENLQLLQAQAGELERLLHSLSKPFEEVDATVENELVALALAVAQHIIRREIKQDPSQIVAVIREAIQLLPVADQKITLSLHPDDAELVRAALKLDDAMPAWRLIENPLLTRGGCLVETDVSRIDATLEHRIAAVVATVWGGERQHDQPHPPAEHLPEDGEA